MIGAFQFQGDDAARLTLGLGAVGDLFGQPPDMAIQQFGIGGVLTKGGFLGNGFHRRIGRHPAAVLSPRQMIEPIAHGPKPRDQILALPSQQIGKGADTRPVERGLGGRTHAPDHADGFVMQKRGRFGGTDHRKPVRFVEIRGDLGQEFIVAQADRPGQPQFIAHPFDQMGQHIGGRVAMQFFGACEVKKGLIQRQWLDRRGQVIHHRADGTAGFDVGGHAGFDDHRVRAEFQRLKHRHGGFDAPDPRDITGGRDHAAPSAADDHGFGRQIRIVALFDRGIEGVTIHMGDGQAAEFGMGNNAGRPAFRTAQDRPARRAIGGGVKHVQAFTAKGVHHVLWVVWSRFRSVYRLL